MALDTAVRGLTGIQADVTSNNYLKIISETNVTAKPDSVGAFKIFSENDDGTITGSTYLMSPETSNDFRLRVGVDTLLFDHSFVETALDIAKWKVSGVTTMTAALASGFLSLNASAAATVSGNYISFNTSRYFRVRGAAQLYVEITANITATPITNQVIEFGLFAPVAGVQPADGIWWQITSAGLIGVMSYNGTLTQTGTLLAPASIPLSNNEKYTITVAENEIEFWVNDQLVGELHVPAGQASPFLTDCLPVCLQQRNSGTVAASGQAVFRVGSVTVTCGDLHTSKPWAHQMAQMGHMAYQVQAGGTGANTAAWNNAAAATPLTGAALSQTATIATGLGGQATITAAVPGIDGMVTAYQNPTGSVTQPPRNLTITGIKISAVNLGANVATTPTTIAWSLGFGATGATIPSLAQAETATLAAASVKLWRRIPLGIQSWLNGALIGQSANDIFMTFDSPIVVFPGEWVAAVCKFIQGTATVSQVIHCHVTFDAHFD